MKNITKVLIVLLVTSCMWQVDAQTSPDYGGTCPTDITVNNDAGNCSAIVTWTEPTAIDPDDGFPATVTQTGGLPSGSDFPVGGPYTIEYTATDNGADPPSICTFTVTVVDNENPVAICQDVIVQLDAAGNATVTAAQINNGSTDNCGIASIAVSPTAFTCANVGMANPVTLFVTDTSGNISSCNANVTVEDNIAPMISCPAAITQDNDPGVCGAVVTYTTPVGTDNCSGATTAQTSGFASGATFPIGTTTNTFTVTDASGNMASCSFTVTINDNEAPVITCPGNISQTNDAGVCGAVINYTVPTSDNCPGETTAQTAGLPSGSTFPIGTTTNTFIVTDAAGLTATCSFDVTITDDEAPNAVCLGPTTYLSSDFEGGTGVWTTGNDATTICGSTSIASTWNLATQTGGAAPVTLGTTWYGMANNGSLGAERSWIESSIFTSTTATMEINFDSYSSNEGGYPTTYDVEHVQASINGGAYTDLHGNDPQLHNNADQTFRNITYSIPAASGDTVQIRFLLDTCDGCCGDSSIIGWFVDNIVVSTPSVPIDVFLDASGNASITVADIDGGSTDNCGIATTTISPSSFTCADVGINIVTLTVTDVNGNVSTCTSEVNVIDNIAPTALCQPFTAQLDATGNVTITAADVDNGSNDACGITMSVSPDAFTCAEVGPNAVTLTVTDSNGNVSTCNTTVTVEDNVAPEALCNSFDVFLDNTGNVSITVGDVDNGSNDACGIASTSIDIMDFTCADVGPNDVTLTVTDNNGNVSTCIGVVTVIDNIPPTIACPADVNADTDPGQCSAVVVFADALALDNCGVASVVQTAGLPSGSMFPVGVSTVEYTATDDNGNMSVCSFTITVTDNEPAMAVCQDITIQLDANGDAMIVAADVDGGSTDNCGVAGISIDIDTFDCSDVGPNNVTLTVTDVNGNVSSCIAVVTVEDITAPDVLCMDITVQLDATGTVTITGTDVDGGSTDACGIASYDLDNDTFDCSNVGPNTVILSVTDVNGNVATCSAEVTVEDVSDPVLVCMDITIELGADGTASITPADVIQSADDACGINTTAVDITDFDCSDVGTPVTVTVFAIDNNGNSALCMAVVTVADALAPVVTCPADVTVDPGAGNLFYELPDYFALGEATAEDNCTDPLTLLSQDPAVGTLLPDGVYTITMTAEDEYGNIGICTFELTVESVLGVGDNEFSLATIVMYPNPARDVVMLSNPQSIELEQATIYDLTGRLIQTIDLTNMGSETVINVSELAAAAYVLVIQSEHGQITKQLLKE